MRWRELVVRCLLVAALFAGARGVAGAQAGVAEHVPGTPGVTIVTDQTGGEVSLKVGAVLEVRLEANHTTGYSWITGPVANPVLARQGRAVYQEHSTEGKAGVGGVEIWRFKAMKTGKQGLSFEYRRPWEKGAPAARMVTFSVTVE